MIQRILLLLSFLSLTACGSSNSSNENGPRDLPALLAAPDLELPFRLSELKLYPNMKDLRGAAPLAHYYEPRWSLWTNGTKKIRHIVLPPGQKIDNSDRARWNFPLGTIFVKTFLYTSKKRGLYPVETRILRGTHRGWAPTVYLWNQDGTDAYRQQSSREIEVEVEDIHQGKFDHIIPGRVQCGECHNQSSAIVIGFDELRLNSPLEGNQDSQLEQFQREGLFLRRASPPFATVDGRSPLEIQVKGYIHGNCAHCHNGVSRVDLRHPTFVQNVVGQETNAYDFPKGLRIDPGHPENSLLYLAVSQENHAETVRQMPPLGVQKIDQEFADELREYILSLKAEAKGDEN